MIFLHADKFDSVEFGAHVIGGQVKIGWTAVTECPSIRYRLDVTDVGTGEVTSKTTDITMIHLPVDSSRGPYHLQLNALTPDVPKPISTTLEIWPNLGIYILFSLIIERRSFTNTASAMNHC